MAKRRQKRGAMDWRRLELSEEDMAYDNEEWVVPARDNLGQSVRAFFRVPPLMDKAIEMLVNSKVFPYLTKADFYRHAAFRMLGVCHRLEPAFPKHFVSALQAMLEIVREDEMRTQMETVFNALAGRIEAHLQRGDAGEAVRVAALTKSRLAHIEDSAWKRRFTARFKRQFTPLLQSQGQSQVQGQGQSQRERKLTFEPAQLALPPASDEED